MHCYLEMTGFKAIILLADDTEFGGIPPVIFTLSSLEELYLDYQAITTVPVHLCRLQNLAVLSLAYNPLLESLPGSLGHLPSLKSE